MDPREPAGGGDEIREAIRGIVFRRARATAVAALVSLGLLALADLRLDAAVRERALLVEAFRAGIVAAGLLGLRRPQLAVPVSAAATSALYLAGALSVGATGRAEGEALIAVVLALVTGIFLPWGLGPQLLTAGLGGGALAWSLAAAGADPPGAPAFRLVTTLAALGVSLYAAYEVNRQLRRQISAELRLRESAEALAEAERLARVGSWSWDVGKNRVTWSEELYRIYGLDPTTFEATFEGYLSRVHPEDREKAARVVQEALRERRPFVFEERIVRPDGTVRVLESRGEVFCDPDGRPVRVVGACLDVTERRRVERELERRTVELERAAETRAHMLSVLSHELRTPIGVALGYLEMIEDGLGRARLEEIRSWLERIRSATLRLLELCDGVLDFRRVESGAVALRIEEVDLRRVLEEFEEEVRLWLGNRPVAFRVECAGPAKIRTDRARLRQVLGNLLHNAAKFTHEGEIVARVRARADRCLLEVADTGPGLPPQRRSDPFAPFGPTAPAGGGSGLGLSIAKKLVEALGGTIRVESEPGNGTLVRVELPAADSEAAEVGRRAAAEERPRAASA